MLLADSNSWQTPAAIAVVLVTLAVFVVRFLRRRSGKQGGGSCGTGCACPGIPEATDKKDRGAL